MGKPGLRGLQLGGEHPRRFCLCVVKYLWQCGDLSPGFPSLLGLSCLLPLHKARR